MVSNIGGRLLLRVEDIDTIRCTRDFEILMLDDLQWLGLVWDEPPVRQTERLDRYQCVLAELEKRELVYPAFMSRGEIRRWVDTNCPPDGLWPRDPDGAFHYPPRDKDMTRKERYQRIVSGEPYSLRLDMTRAMENLKKPIFWRELESASGTSMTEITANPQDWGDVLLGRKDVSTSYHLACVVDDAAQNISHIVRGKDLYQATSVHRLLQKLLNLPAPIYHHHRLILDDKGKKLSKSRKDVSIHDLRQSGSTQIGRAHV